MWKTNEAIWRREGEERIYDMNRKGRTKGKEKQKVMIASYLSPFLRR